MTCFLLSLGLSLTVTSGRLFPPCENTNVSLSHPTGQQFTATTRNGPDRKGPLDRYYVVVHVHDEEMYNDWDRLLP